MRHLRRLGHCLAAGALTGAALAPIQLLLWPEVRLSVPGILLAILAWSSWSAVWLGGTAFVVVEFAALFAPYLAANSGFSIGLWRWLAVASSAMVTTIAWWNREESWDLISLGVRQALAVGGSLAFLFTIAVLVQAVRRPPRKHALGISSAAAIVLTASLWGIWAAQSVPIPANPPGPIAPFKLGHRLLLVSWEGADLTWILPAVERGDMPFFRGCRTNGAWGQLRAIRPHNRVVAIATLLTGCTPAAHGALGRHAYRLEWLSDESITLLMAGPWRNPRQLPWRAWQRSIGPPPQRAEVPQIVALGGGTAGVAGWPWFVQGTWTEPPVGFADSVPVAAGDSELMASLEPALRLRPEFAAAARSAISASRVLVARTSARLASNTPDALLVNEDLPATLRPIWTSEDPDSPSEDVLRAAAHQLDEHLRSLWLAMGGDDTLLVVTSPYGMAPPTSWQRVLSLGATPERWHVSASDSPDGFVLFFGPGVRPGARLRAVRLADVTPTTLYLLNAPVARDMAGRVLLDAVTDERTAVTPLRMVSTFPLRPRVKELSR